MEEEQVADASGDKKKKKKKKVVECIFIVRVCCLAYAPFPMLLLLYLVDESHPKFINHHGNCVKLGHLHTESIRHHSNALLPAYDSLFTRRINSKRSKSKCKADKI